MTEFLVDLFPVLFCLCFILLLTVLYSKSQRFKSKQIPDKFLFVGLLLKVFATFLFCFVFAVTYEGGGDTVSYHDDALLITKYLLNDPVGFSEIWMGGEKQWLLNTYYHSSAAPAFWTNPYEYNIVRFIVPFEIISFGNFLACSIWISFLAFTGIWKLFEMLCYLFKKDMKLLSVILFFPSVLFWTAGILKDTFVIFAICWMVYSVFNLILLKRIKLKYFLIILISSLIIVLLKPYIVVVLLPCLFLWVSIELLKQVKDKSLRLLFSPVYILSSIAVIALLLTLLKDDLGVYGNYSELLEHSSIVREGFNSTNKNDLLGIDAFDFTNSSSISNGLISTLSVIHRPFLWESWNALSFITGLENFFLLFLCLWAILSLLFDLKSVALFIKNPFLIFCIFYSLLLAIGIGLSVSNFGAIVRFKSSFMLFYLVPFIVIIGSVKRKIKHAA